MSLFFFYNKFDFHLVLNGAHICLLLKLIFTYFCELSPLESWRVFTPWNILNYWDEKIINSKGVDVTTWSGGGSGGPCSCVERRHNVVLCVILCFLLRVAKVWHWWSEMALLLLMIKHWQHKHRLWPARSASGSALQHLRAQLQITRSAPASFVFWHTCTYTQTRTVILKDIIFCAKV